MTGQTTFLAHALSYYIVISLNHLGLLVALTNELLFFSPPISCVFRRYFSPPTLPIAWSPLLQLPLAEKKRTSMHNHARKRKKKKGSSICQGRPSCVASPAPSFLLPPICARSTLLGRGIGNTTLLLPPPPQLNSRPPSVRPSSAHVRTSSSDLRPATPKATLRDARRVRELTFERGWQKKRREGGRRRSSSESESGRVEGEGRKDGECCHY